MYIKCMSGHYLCMHVCMYVCIGVSSAFDRGQLNRENEYSSVPEQSLDQPGKVANPGGGQLNRKSEEL